ncbi:hypothetical protein K435DRAFT_820684 [Dendrothele bispora CBS 962.96]|uniref:Uncharacterized protein n=1 Tax=Dendrothele bispora (strain CBS 962.96) TaxID=1314807 RepID=A0A4S8LRF9_DENBC|nr:hypothetical protein K435DRAFT_820684 [Dendrothele bispora CBS 962.96]
MNDPKNVAGTKLRLWTLQIPLPKMCPIVIAAIAIPESLTVPNLLDMHKEIIFGLLEADVLIVSYSCDGTENERSVQRQFVDIAETHLTILIAGPGDGYDDLNINIGVFKGKPIVMVQDSKHALKTARNNLFSGARLFALGNHIATYHQVRRIAYEPESPLYIRDVEKLDRQDDNAAARLFSAAMLRYLIDHHRADTGLIVYLFIFGELCDAFQNRHLPHAERINMLLRTRYFMQMWSKYVDKIPHYTHSQYLVSREFTEIIESLVNGLISLIIVHRDYVQDIIPLLPWLHSSEPCEHIFGIARQIVSDFTMLDFLHMIPKLAVRMREVFLDSAIDKAQAESAARAAGYHHTYFDVQGIDLLSLSRFPDNDEITIISKQAMQEAESLVILLGILPQKLHSPNSSTYLSISHGPTVPDEIDMVPDDLMDDDDDCIVIGEIPRLIQVFEKNAASLKSHQRDRLENLTNAYLALTVEDQMRMYALQESLSSVTEADQCVYTSVASLTYAIDEPDHDEIDLNSLVLLREQHQTRHAARSVRIHGRTTDKDSATGTSNSSESQSAKSKILLSFYEELKKAQDRRQRWYEMRAPGRETSTTDTPLTGNSANALQLAAKRRQIYLKFKVPRFIDALAEARVTSLKPLRLGDWAIVYLESENKIFVAKVMAMYARGGGKNGKHASVDSASMIASLSRIVVQIFESSSGAQFRIFPDLMSPLGTKGFALLPAHAFLTTLDMQPTAGNLQGSLLTVPTTSRSTT